jgi:hypothetical protein
MQYIHVHTSQVLKKIILHHLFLVNHEPKFTTSKMLPPMVPNEFYGED